MNDINFLNTIILIVICLVLFLPPTLIILLYFKNKFQTHHSILRQHPILGQFRYIIEKLGPELRFYITDDDNSGKPFSRIHFTNIVMAAKYCKTVIGFGSKRNFSTPGLYLNNAMFPLQNAEMQVDNSNKFETQKSVVVSEGIFTRKEKREQATVQPWKLTEENAIIFGPHRKNPYKSYAFFGCSAMSYGSLGSHAISAINLGIAMTGSGWHNTGEGGVSPFHLLGSDVISQIGSGKFGYRTEDGKFNWEALKEKAHNPNIKMFEIKLAQGAKIKGGHLEAVKVTPEIAAIRMVKPWTAINSPNRFEEFNNVDELLDFVDKMQKVAEKPVGIKLVVGNEFALDELAEKMAKTGKGPDFVTVDGGEGGSGATYQEMADSMGLPVFSAVVIADDTFRKYGVRDRIKLIASGKLHTADQICIALALGADSVNIARGFMMAAGCIMTEKCHTGKCPVGVATNDPFYMKALVVDEKKYRVANYVTTLRAACFSLAAACGIDSPTKFNRTHVVYKYGDYRTARADRLFPSPV